MENGFSKNMNVQMLIALLKAHGIKHIITSPGGTNLEFVAGLQYDGSFNLYSSVDERSAAYMACGMVSELNIPVAISCTEATASRDYFPGITEAYHRKLPILVITGVHDYAQIGHLQPQVIDRSTSPKDMFVEKVHLPVIKDENDMWQSELLINKAILALKKNGGGPVHIDLPCINGNYDFSVISLPKVKCIHKFYVGDELPDLPQGKTAVFLGSHKKFQQKEIDAIDNFCKAYDAVVFCDCTSGYNGKYAVHFMLQSMQAMFNYDEIKLVDTLIHIGEEPADEASMRRLAMSKQVWRVSSDGELRDSFKKLTNVFEMKEQYFFEEYAGKVSSRENHTAYLEQCRNITDNFEIPYADLPFSNIYAASKIIPELPNNSVLHLGLSNTLRAWSMFGFLPSVSTSSNVGCRGIDGVLSTVIGASLIHPDKLYFCALGDLTFFYDMNALGNRYILNNLRIILINNNGGGIFKQKAAPGHKFFGDEITNQYIAASGHFGNKSSMLVKHLAEDLGFEYITASNKEDFEKVYKTFICSEVREKPIIFEIFTNDDDERNSFEIMMNIEKSSSLKAKNVAKSILGEKGTKFVKKLISK